MRPQWFAGAAFAVIGLIFTSSEIRAQNADRSPSVNAVRPAMSGGFTPTIGLVLSGLYTRTSRDPATYRLPGLMTSPDVGLGPGTRSFGLGDSELLLGGNADAWISGYARLGLDPSGEVEIEEAVVQSTALGHGLNVKAGRFFSGIGYLNPLHPHEWDFVDNPLAYQALLGTQYNDDGVSVRWVAPTTQFIELGAEIGRGRSFPAGGNAGNGAGMSSFSAHTGGDIGESHSWRAGVSMLNTKALDQAWQAHAGDGQTQSNQFSGKTRTWVLDAVWKWAPDGNYARKYFKLQGEYLSSRHDGQLTLDPTAGDAAGQFGQRNSGWYVQSIYQFMPRWRVGLRVDRMSLSTFDTPLADQIAGPNGGRARRESVMVDFSPSEFSRLRVQLAQDRSRPGELDHQFFVQYLVSFGAHGAHRY